MDLKSVRPNVSEVKFQLFRGPIHPELLDICAQLRIFRERYTAWVVICRAGHCVSVQTDHESFTELVGASELEGLERRRILTRRFRGYMVAGRRFDSGTTYDVSFELERLDTTSFRHVHDELALETRKAALSHIFSSANRLLPAPLSLLHVEATGDSLLVHSFHTFPESLAVVRTQSLVEVK